MLFYKCYNKNLKKTSYFDPYMLQYTQMKIILPENLIKLSEICPSEIYVVGGYVRNFLINGMLSDDIDIAAPLDVEEIKSAAEQCGFNTVAEYKRTGTLVISDGKRKYEYTRFRTDSYARGGAHEPTSTEFTDDISRDALRRDFKCNAVYYDIRRQEIVDPLGGVSDIENRVLDTVATPEGVFCSDGLRLMRLARFAAELNFIPKTEVIRGAKQYADNIRDIAPERIFEELKKILVADGKYPFSDPKGHYTGFKILDGIGVFDILFPELAAGRGMAQRADFHNYDVLEHTFRTLLYSDSEIRLAALLHDVGKPYCQINFGRYKDHHTEGEKIAREILKRLKADKKTTEKTAFLVRWHMFDLKNAEPESELRLFIVENRENFIPLLKLKQADFSACKDDLSACPAVKRWTALYDKMKSDGTPFSLKDLDITAADVVKIGFSERGVGEELKNLFRFAVISPENNCFQALNAKAREDYRLRL